MPVENNAFLRYSSSLWSALFLTLPIRYGSSSSTPFYVARPQFALSFVNLVWLIIFLHRRTLRWKNRFILAKIFHIAKTMAIGAGIAVLMFYFIPASLESPPNKPFY